MYVSVYALADDDVRTDSMVFVCLFVTGRGAVVFNCVHRYWQGASSCSSEQ